MRLRYLSSNLHHRITNIPRPYPTRSPLPSDIVSFAYDFVLFRSDTALFFPVLQRSTRTAPALSFPALILSTGTDTAFFFHETSHLPEPLQHQGGEEFSPRIETAKSRCLKDSPSQKSISYLTSLLTKKDNKEIIRFKKAEQSKAKAKRSACKSISLICKYARAAPDFFHSVPELRFSLT